MDPIRYVEKLSYGMTLVEFIIGEASGGCQLRHLVTVSQAGTAYGNCQLGH